MPGDRAYRTPPADQSSGEPDDREHARALDRATIGALIALFVLGALQLAIGRVDATETTLAVFAVLGSGVALVSEVRARRSER